MFNLGNDEWFGLVIKNMGRCISLVRVRAISSSLGIEGGGG